MNRIPAQRVLVYGASGHGKVVADILRASYIEVAGFIDDDFRSATCEILGLEVLGNRDWLADSAKSGPVAVALGIGDNSARQKVAQNCMAGGIALVTAIHPAATVAPSAQIGSGAVVMAAAVINPDAQVGAGAIINTGAIVEHDCRVGDFAHLSPKAAMGGCAQLGNLSWLGIGATIIHGVKVGAGTIIGAGAAVVRDIPDDVIAVGVPARVRRKLNERDAAIER
jgi:sugar O-acyltransferase (sialic acid O-acetyltransferase NeuD family)